MTFLLIVERSQEEFDTLEEAQQAMAVEKAKFETGPYHGTAEMSLCVVLYADVWVCSGKQVGG